MSNPYNKIIAKILDELLRIITANTSIWNLSEIVLGYAGYDSFGLFMSISAIQMDSVDAICGPKQDMDFTVNFGLSDDYTQITIRKYEYINNRRAIFLRDAADGGKLKFKFDLQFMHEVISTNDTDNAPRMIGGFLKNVLIMPWWGNLIWTPDGERNLGVACLTSLIRKANIMYYRCIRDKT